MSLPPALRDVFVVDDDAFMVATMTTMLGRLGGFTVHGYTDARAAFAAIRDRARASDIVILDINMPDIDGLAFFRQLADVGYQGCLALCSGESDALLRTTAQLARAYGLRVNGSLPKPPSVELLRALLGGVASGVPASARRRERTQEELLAAIDAGEIFCEYQPKVELAGGALRGVEALVRWRHEVDGVIPPADFIEMAERRGAISPLTRRVFDLAVAQQAAWKRRGLDILVSINASVLDLGDLDFPDFLKRCTERHGVDPTAIVIEVTESGLARDERVLTEVLTRLRLRRFQISIDDFGNGYSTLAKLRDLVFDEIKIDRGFTHGAAAYERRAAIFHASVDVGRRLGMKIVAEGIEDRADWDFSRLNGADLAQGNYVSPPLGADALVAWHDAWARRHAAATAEAR